MKDAETLDLWLKNLVVPYNKAFKFLTTTGECSEIEAIDLISTYMKESRRIAKRTLESIQTNV